MTSGGILHPFLSHCERVHVSYLLGFTTGTFGLLDFWTFLTNLTMWGFRPPYRGWFFCVVIGWPKQILRPIALMP
jgi:hypothetical protein